MQYQAEQADLEPYRGVSEEQDIHKETEPH